MSNETLVTIPVPLKRKNQYLALLPENSLNNIELFHAFQSIVQLQNNYKNYVAHILQTKTPFTIKKHYDFS